MIHAEVVDPPTTIRAYSWRPVMPGSLRQRVSDRSEKRNIARWIATACRGLAGSPLMLGLVPSRARNVRASVQVARVVVERRRIDRAPCNDTRAAAATFDVRLSAATTLSAERFMEV